MKKKTIWTIVALVGSYVTCQIIADIGATKMVQMGNYIIPAGTFIFAVTFTLRDMVHKRLGKTWAQAAIVMAGVFNLVMSGYLALMAKLPYPVFFELGGAWDSVFAVIPAIVIGSISAEMISELIDTEVYHLWTRKLPNAPQWTRVIASNLVSLPIDSFVFATMAFVIFPRLFGSEAMSFTVAVGLTVGQMIWKGVVTVISLPGIYLVKEKKIV